MEEVTGESEGLLRLFGTRVLRIGKRHSCRFGRLPALAEAIRIVTMESRGIFEIPEVDDPHPWSDR